MNESWHLSKSVPITLIISLILQAGSIIWVVSQMQADINNNSRNIQTIETKVAELERGVNAQAVQLGRIEENIKAVRDTLNSIAQTLQKNN